MAFIGFQANEDASRRTTKAADAIVVNEKIAEEALKSVRDTDLQDNSKQTQDTLKQVVKSVSEISTYRDFMTEDSA